MNALCRNVHIHIEERGEGAPSLIFLHYWGGSSRTWDYVINALPFACHTLALDLRGWGASDAPDKGYALADFAGDVQRVIAERGLSTFVLIGHSMGGKIAQFLASRRPAGLAGLVLVAPSPPTPLGLPSTIREEMESAYRSTASVEATIDQVLTAKPLTKEQRKQVIEDSLRGGAAAKIAWPRYTSQEDISEEMSAITVPTLVIAGELDRVDSVSTLEIELLMRIPHADMHVLPGTGHLSPLESPRDIAELIGIFLSSLAQDGHKA
ncbi:alpha/beta fold hydrolase [Sodalis sp. RH21]|uniref:alpha/beta fold hydrolase n=1 Tax=unclassified Sodalis (in: enterobacteria) TaxID=2636512 RepID=UPI0039B690F0